jgi:hypothetical protein
MAEACEALGLASEPRTVSAGRHPAMEVAGIPHGRERSAAARQPPQRAVRASAEGAIVVGVARADEQELR